MFNLKNKKYSEYLKDKNGDFLDLKKVLEDYWSKSRAAETETIVDLEKHLWLANGASAIVSIGYIQAKDVICLYQYYGAWAFVSGILMLVLMKYCSNANSSRDLNRFQDAKSQFDADEKTDCIFKDIRDKKFKVLNKCYLYLQRGAGLAFVGGCILTLIGVQG